MTTLTTHPGATLRELTDLHGRVAVVTGGAMGIGRGIADRLHEAGARVVIADVDPDAAERAAEALNLRRELSTLAVTTDVSDEAAVHALIDRTVEHFGSVDVLVNNAGIYPFVSLEAVDVATFRRVLDINLVGLFMCTKVAANQMIAQGRGGSIINVTSIDAVHPSMVGLAHYDASKHGAWGFTKNVALELAEHGIRVNAIAPGGIATPGTGFDPAAELSEELTAAIDATRERIPMHRLGEPDEIGRVALFLASDLSSYMTGSQVIVDGGLLLR